MNDSFDTATNMTQSTEGQPRSEMAKQEAVDLRGRAADAAGSVTDTAKQELDAVTGQATSQVRELAAEARGRLGSELDRGTIQASAALADAGHELVQMADTADADSPAARLVRTAGERAEATAHRLEARGAQGVVDDVTRYARNNPGIFLAGAAALGFAVGRLVRNTDTGPVLDAAKSELGPAADEPAPAAPSNTVSPGSSAADPIDLARPTPARATGSLTSPGVSAGARR